MTDTTVALLTLIVACIGVIIAKKQLDKGNGRQNVIDNTGKMYKSIVGDNNTIISNGLSYKDTKEIVKEVVQNTPTHIEIRNDDPPTSELYPGRMWIRADLIDSNTYNNIK